MTVEAIAAEILRDREARISKPTNAGDTPCFKCGKLFEYRGVRGDNSGRFCSDHCRAEYDLPGSFLFDPFKVTKWKVVAGGDSGYLVATPLNSHLRWRMASSVPRLRRAVRVVGLGVLQADVPTGLRRARRGG